MERVECFGTLPETKGWVMELIKTSEPINANWDWSDFALFHMERKRVICTMDEKKIKNFYARWNIEFPRQGVSFWQAVAEAVLLMDDAPTNARREALQIMDEMNIEWREPTFLSRQ